MSTTLYSVTSRNLEELSRSTDYRYEGNDRDVYQWNEFEIENNEIVGYITKIFDPEACLLYKIFQDN